ncbi:FHA domain-containing protein [Nocardioides litoris]|uniref:FHA domain-containing protein n=1 Tax=Nocardioides litoris TaxID=1926648 RepID=UPI001121E508|nr:FHA domain-containing protein [Nocardioides litoris]
MEVTYTPGDGVAVGLGARWVLISVDPGPEALDEAWALLQAPRPDHDAVLRAVHGDVPGVGVVMVDLTPGAESSVARGGAQHSTYGGVHTLELRGQAVPGAPERRLVGGVVGAARLTLAPAARPAAGPGPGAPTSAAPAPARPAAAAPVPAPVQAGPGVIDGIPADLLAAASSPAAPPPATRPAAPSGPPAAPPAPPVPQAPQAPPPQVPQAPPVAPAGPPVAPAGPPVEASPFLATPGHLQQGPGETVLAVQCPVGHVTAAYHPRCRVCDAPVPPQEPRRLPRPRLGTLHLPDGERVPLDRGVVIGRQPAPVPGGAEWPHLVRLPADATYVSRSHLTIELDGWLVLATDLGSSGGTTLRAPGRAPQRIRGHEPYVWEAGEVLDLADSFEIVYEVTA